MAGTWKSTVWKGKSFEPNLHFWGVPAVTLPKTNVTMENPPFEDVFPFWNMVIFQAGFSGMALPGSICGKHRPGGLQLHVDLPRRHTIPNRWCWVSAWILDKNDGLHPGRLTWNLKMMVWKMIFLFNWVVFRFHVNLPGCIWKKQQ